MAVIEFQSKSNPQHVFCILPANVDFFSSARWEYSDKTISPRVCWSDCINDYPTKHTPWGLLISERLEEFLYSLACYMKEHGCNPVISSMWAKNLNPVIVQRFYEMKYNEKRKSYYNQFGETSISVKKGKERGWKEIPEWATGSNNPATIYGLWEHGQHNSLYALHFLFEVGKIVPGHWKIPERFLPHGLKEREVALTWLIRTCQSYIDAFRAKEEANENFESYEVVK